MVVLARGPLALELLVLTRLCGAWGARHLLPLMSLPSCHLPSPPLFCTGRVLLRGLCRSLLEVQVAAEVGFPLQA
jgi:hypothetical protein